MATIKRPTIKSELFLLGLIVIVILAFNLPTFIRQYRRVLDVSQSGKQQTALKVAGDAAVLSGKDISQIRQGEKNLLVLSREGNVYVRGNNDYGQLGTGTFGGDQTELTQVHFPSPVHITKIDMVQNHALALTSTGDVYAWGLNISGEIGNGTNVDSPSPVKVFEHATAIAAGYRFSAAIDQNGHLWAWGMDCNASTPAIAKLAAEFAQNASLGGSYYNGIEQPNNLDDCLNQNRLPIASLTPREFPNPGVRYTAVSGGYGHLLMLDSTGTVWSFGCNTWGQLGRLSSNYLDYRTPARVSIPSNHKIVRLAAGFRHSVALDDQGHVWIWGNDFKTSTLNDPKNTTIIQVTLPAGIKPVGIEAGYDITGIVTADHTVYALGANTNARIAASGTTYIATPTKLSPDATSLSLGRTNAIYWNNEANF